MNIIIEHLIYLLMIIFVVILSYKAGIKIGARKANEKFVNERNEITEFIDNNIGE